MDATSWPAKVSLEYCAGVALLVGKRSYLCGEIMAVETGTGTSTGTSTPPSAVKLLLPSGR